MIRYVRNFVLALIYYSLQAYVYTPPFHFIWIFLSVVLGSLLMSVSLEVLFKVIKDNHGNFLCPEGMAVLGFILYFLCAPFVMFERYNLDVSERLYGVSASDFTQLGPTFTLSILGLFLFWVAFTIGLFWTRLKKTGREEQQSLDVYRDKMKQAKHGFRSYMIAGLLFYFLGIAVVWLWLGGIFNWLSATISSFIARGQGVRFVGQSGYGYIEIINKFADVGIIIFIIILYLIFRNKLARPIIWVIGFVLSFLAYGYIGSRTAVLIVILWLLIIHSMLIKPIKFKNFVLLGFVIVFLALFMNSVSHFANIGQRPGSIVDLLTYTINASAVTFVAGIDLSRVLPTVVMFKHSLQGDITLGSTFIASLLHPLPNYVWPFSRPLNIEQFAAWKAEIDPYGHRSHPIIGMPGEAFINFSWFGVMLIGFVLGLITSYCQKFYNMFVQYGNIASGVIAVILSVFTFTITATQSFILFYQLVILAITIIGFLFVTKIKWK
ncbi:hypothetical protein [Paenibacillus koleovorans]|uniref:hypothetical protein n=1 Tax=Paenibacillus koleovorans TaxID=121608 RepID=UPI000FD8ECA6|nr:hypothetical protein [Paenibacillus koleovorans]